MNEICDRNYIYKTFKIPFVKLFLLNNIDFNQDEKSVKSIIKNIFLNETKNQNNLCLEMLIKVESEVGVFEDEYLKCCTIEWIFVKLMKYNFKENHQKSVLNLFSKRDQSKIINGLDNISDYI